MRTRRRSPLAVLIALIAILVGIIITLLVGRGPTAHADGPAPGTMPAGTSPPPGPATDGKGGQPAGPPHRTKQSTPTKTATRTKTATPSKTATPTKTPTKTPTGGPTQTKQPPPRFGKAGTPAGTNYSVSGDGRAFGFTFSTLETSTESDHLTRTLSMTVPVSGDTGDTNVVLAVQGYVLTDRGATAKLTVRANGISSTTTYRPDTELSLTRVLDVPLHGGHECRITIKIELLPDPGADAYLNVNAVDGELN